MTLRHYQIFVAVCDTMNMTNAALRLYMSQPAVSQAIAELEQYYQTRLFERLSRKLYLTQAGERLSGFARHIIRLNADAESEMRALRQGSRVRVGVSVTIGSCILPALAADLKKEEPCLDMEVWEDNTVQIERLVLKDQLDLGLVEGEVTSSDLVCRPFLKDELVLICSSTHPFSKQRSILARELEQENMILREPGSGTRKTFETAMEASGLLWHSAWTCNNTDSIKAAVAKGIGVSVLSRRAVSREIKEGDLVEIPIDDLSFWRTFQVVYHKNKYFTQAMTRFIDYCIQKKQDFRAT